MARDYKSRAHPKPKKGQTPGWVWFATGVLVGLFAAGLVWLKLGPPAPGSPGPQTAAPRPEPKKEQKPLPPKPRFDFYTELPEMEVVVPEPEPEARPGKATQRPSAAAVTQGAPTASTAYMLQMGSFRKYADADRMKAGLALLGIEARIQKVNIDNRDIFHRVRSGPYYSSRQVNRIRARLRQNGINSLLIKLKK